MAQANRLQSIIEDMARQQAAYAQRQAAYQSGYQINWEYPSNLTTIHTEISNEDKPYAPRSSVKIDEKQMEEFFKNRKVFYDEPVKKTEEVIKYPEFTVGQTVVLHDGRTGIIVFSQNESFTIHCQDGNLVENYPLESLKDAFYKYQNNKPITKDSQSFVQKYINNLNNYKINLQKSFDKYSADIGYFEGKILEIKGYCETIKQKIASLNNKDNGLKEKFTKEIESIQKHAFVDRVWIGENDCLAILTKPLSRVDQETGKNIDPNDDLGRFIIKIQADRRIYVDVFGLDYIYEGYTHPHLGSDHDGHVCWGNFEQPVRDALDQGDYYQLIDMTITFLSTLPQAEGNPYISYTNWLTNRKNRKINLFSFIERLGL